jgi:TM2 domain-containing membrane protein YozV
MQLNHILIGMGTSHKSKAAAAGLAALLGAVGAHRLYLGARGWWWYAVVAVPCAVWSLQFAKWYQQPAFFIGMVPVIAGLLEAIIISLTPDERWDARHNAHSAQRSHNRWPPVLIAVSSLLIGASLLMLTLVLMFQTYFESQLPP